MMYRTSERKEEKNNNLNQKELMVYGNKIKLVLDEKKNCQVIIFYDQGSFNRISERENS